MKRISKVAIIGIIVLLAVPVGAYAFIPLGSPFWTCPLVRTTPGYAGTAGSPFSIVQVGNFGNPAGQGNTGSGTIRWCIYSNAGLLERSYLTDRRLNGWVSSDNGSVVAVLGNKLSGGRVSSPSGVDSTSSTGTDR